MGTKQEGKQSFLVQCIDQFNDRYYLTRNSDTDFVLSQDENAAYYAMERDDLQSLFKRISHFNDRLKFGYTKVCLILRKYGETNQEFVDEVLAEKIINVRPNVIKLPINN